VALKVHLLPEKYYRHSLFYLPEKKGEPIPPNFPTEPIIPPPDVDMPAHEVLEQIMFSKDCETVKP
jgi:hypothetical protein